MKVDDEWSSTCSSSVYQQGESVFLGASMKAPLHPPPRLLTDNCLAARWQALEEDDGVCLSATVETVQEAKSTTQAHLDTELFALLLMVLEWIGPGVASPLRPICDLRVLDHFIKEAQDAEVAMRLCRVGCGLSMSVIVPQTRVDFVAWEMKNTVEQAQEVQAGLWLLNQAMSSLKASASNAVLRAHTDSALRNILSIGQVLRSLNIQEFTTPGTFRAQETWRVSTASELLKVHVNFLRGKVRLLLSNAPACHQDVS